jgi:PAS domain-containing protein
MQPAPSVFPDIFLLVDDYELWYSSSCKAFQERRIAMEQSLEIKELLKLAVDSLYLSIVIDETGSIRYLGRPYADIIGVGNQDVIGMPVDKLIPNTRLKNIVKSKDR